MHPQLPLPNCSDEPYQNSFSEIEARLKAVQSVGDFLEFLKEKAGDDVLSGLLVWKEKLVLSYHSIIGHCLLLPALFPHGTLPFLAPGTESTISLSLAQLRCLNAHRFICSFKKLSEHPCKWPMNLNHWLVKKPSWFPEGQAYLECLLDYFADFPPGSADETARSVTFSRHVLSDAETPDWDNDEFADAVVAEADVVDDGTGIGDGAGEVMADFANEDIGPSVAATQEEIVFGFAPELQPAVLFAGRMLDTDAIVMAGARRYGRHSGYGCSLRYHGRAEDREEARTVLAIDAKISRRGLEGVKEQLTEGFMRRELGKALAGFRAVAGASEAGATVLATGKWGCGVFGGDLDVKHSVQMMACALLRGRLRLRFYCVEQDDFSLRLRAAQPLLAGRTVRDVLRALEAYRRHLDAKGRAALPFFSFITAEPSASSCAELSYGGEWGL